MPQAFNGNLGGFQLEFVESQDGILASIEDVDGIVDVAGTITLRLDRSYTLLAQVAARPTTPPALNQALRLLPRGNAANQYEVRLEGSL